MWLSRVGCQSSWDIFPHDAIYCCPSWFLYSFDQRLIKFFFFAVQKTQVKWVTRYKKNFVLCVHLVYNLQPKWKLWQPIFFFFVVQLTFRDILYRPYELVSQLGRIRWHGSILCTLISYNDLDRSMHPIEPTYPCLIIVFPKHIIRYTHYYWSYVSWKIPRPSSVMIMFANGRN